MAWDIRAKGHDGRMNSTRRDAGPSSWPPTPPARSSTASHPGVGSGSFLADPHAAPALSAVLASPQNLLHEFMARAGAVGTVSFAAKDVAAGPGDHRRLRMLANRGKLVRVSYGVYAPAHQWHQLRPRQQHCDMATTLARITPGAQLARDTVALMWGLPWLGAMPDKVHMLGVRAAGGRSTGRIRRLSHGLDPDAGRCGGVYVLSVARTVVDVARAHSLPTALACADAALRQGLVTRAQLLDQCERAARTSGTRMTLHAKRVIDLADERCESAGESLCRANCSVLGYATPESQHTFRDAQGLIGYGDRYWDRPRSLLEFDGKVKYQKPEFLRGRDPGEVVFAEKVREDRIRAMGVNVRRAVWRVARDLRAFDGLLRELSVPRVA